MPSGVGGPTTAIRARASSVSTVSLRVFTGLSGLGGGVGLTRPIAPGGESGKGKRKRAGPRDGAGAKRGRGAARSPSPPALRGRGVRGEGGQGSPGTEAVS